jgi:hypothetical protein
VIRFLTLLEEGGWRLKLYGIAEPERAMPGLEWAPPVRSLAREDLRSRRSGFKGHGAGFATVHHGFEANFVLLDWRVGLNMLENHVHLSPLDDPFRLERVTPTGLSACVWELAIMAYEREARLETVLANPEGPDLEAYPGRRLNAEV